MLPSAGAQSTKVKNQFFQSAYHNLVLNHVRFDDPEFFKEKKMAAFEGYSPMELDRLAFFREVLKDAWKLKYVCAYVTEVYPDREGAHRDRAPVTWHKDECIPLKPIEYRFDIERTPRSHRESEGGHWINGRPVRWSSDAYDFRETPPASAPPRGYIALSTNEFTDGEELEREGSSFLFAHADRGDWKEAVGPMTPVTHYLKTQGVPNNNNPTGCWQFKGHDHQLLCVSGGDSRVDFSDATSAYTVTTIYFVFEVPSS